MISGCKCIRDTEKLPGCLLTRSIVWSFSYGFTGGTIGCYGIVFTERTVGISGVRLNTSTV